MHRNQSVNPHKFAMVPRADIPRSGFKIETSHKTCFNSGYLIPVYVNEVLPGDTFNVKMTAFCRLATPIVPVMDNMYLDSFFFFVPCRLLWGKWEQFMGEETNPGLTTNWIIPWTESPVGGFAESSIYDYMGIPCATQIDGAATLEVNVLPLRAYNLIWNEWFRDQNLQDRAIVDNSDGPDAYGDFVVRRRGKRHDYFTSCLPWVQKGDPVSMPLGTTAPVVSNELFGGTGAPAFLVAGMGGNRTLAADTSGASEVKWNAPVSVTGPVRWETSPTGTGLIADLSGATAATINQLRQSFQIQKLLERDARGGTRYTEIIRSHFGVISPDARLQRPEYLGGGSTPVSISPIAQTAVDGDTPVGNLSAFGTALAHGHGFTQSFTEHGYVIGLVSVRADLNYQQGLRKMWSRKTRYDFYFPVFAMLGEQAVLNKEIYTVGFGGASPAGQDEEVFGYQERWAEYRYQPSLITSSMRSTADLPLDVWHLAQKFGALPLLDDAFIQENPPIDRIIATETPTNGFQFLCDIFFRNNAARCLPMYSVPGLVDHF